MYDPERALIVVDVQNDFADPKGSLYVPGATAVVPTVNREVVRATAAGAAVVYTQDWHPPRTPHFVEDGGPWPAHCVRDTWGAEFHPRLLVAGPVVRKGEGGEDGYSGFATRDPETGQTASTALHELLQTRLVTHLTVVGIARDVCVKETACDGAALGYRVTVLAEATAAVNVSPGDDERAVAAMEEAGVEVVRPSR